MNKKRLLTVMGGKKKTWSVAFNGTTSSINAGSEASVDDLLTGAVTIECYFLGNPAIQYPRLFDKTGSSSVGWYVALRSHVDATGYYFNVYTDGSEKSMLIYNVTANDMKWHHIACTYDNGGDKKRRIYIDGNLIGASDALAGTLNSDASVSLFAGNRSDGSRCLNGRIGWSRISNSVRYSSNFIPPSRFVYPTVDANTVRLFKMNEGTGTTITDYSANAQNGTSYATTWIYT